MNKAISLSKVLALTLASLVLFNMKDMMTEFSNHDVQQFISYVGSFLLFSFMCFMENKEGFSFPFQKSITDGLNYISKISYPLYLIHAVPGYVMMYICYDQGYSLFTGMVLGLVGSFVGAHYLTKYIETPVRLFGNVVSSRANKLQFVNP
jgi:peptidoglycan/LPS O-acetylase OafA/YrhL